MSTMLALGRHHAGGNDALGCWRPAVWATAVYLPLLIVAFMTSPRDVPIGSSAMLTWSVIVVSMTLVAATWVASSRAATQVSWIAGSTSVLAVFAGIMTVSW